MRAAVVFGLLIAGCKQGPSGLPLFEPVGVGFGLDAVLLPDGSLTGYDYGGETRQPSVVLVFVSEAYFSATSDAMLLQESCAAVSPFDAPLRSAPLTTEPEQTGEAALYRSYEAQLQITAHSCAGRLDPAWGQDAELLWSPFEGVTLGYGVGPMTDALRATWSEDALSSLGGSMAAGWVALQGEELELVATDDTTGLLYAYDPATGQIPTEIDAYGNEQLIPSQVSSLASGQGFVGAYLQSIPAVYRLGLSPGGPLPQ